MVYAMTGPKATELTHDRDTGHKTDAVMAGKRKRKLQTAKAHKAQAENNNDLKIKQQLNLPKQA
jgi:hypothetical protein